LKTRITLKQINKIAIPALVSSVSEPLLSLTDAAVIGNIKHDATECLAAIGIATTFLSMLIWVLGQTRSAISSIISQYLGAKKLNEVKNLPAQAILIITSLSVIIAIGTYPFAKSIFMLYNAKGLILDYCVTYYKIRIIGFPFIVFTIAIFGAFRGLQNTFHPMIIAVTGTIINVILDLVLVYGFQDIIMPMGIEGAAYASVISQIFMAVFSVYHFITKTEISLKLYFPLNKEITRFLLMIFNLFIRTVALNVTLYFASSYATDYGAEYIAAYTIAINLWFLGMFIIDGYASAGNILSGKLLGEKAYQPLLQLGNTLTKYGIFIGCILGILGGIFYYSIGRFFTQDIQVLSIFYDSFWIVLIMQPLCAISVIFDGIFKGLGKMKYLRNVLLASTFLVFIPVLLCLDALQYKLHGIFIGIMLWVIARGTPLFIKFRRVFIPLSKKI